MLKLKLAPHAASGTIFKYLIGTGRFEVGERCLSGNVSGSVSFLKPNNYIQCNIMNHATAVK